MTTLTNPSDGTMWSTDCIACDNDRVLVQRSSGNLISALMRRMIVCPDCGNKRCPKASHHDNPCSGSNEVGQSGSIYGSQVFPEKISGEPKIVL
jgi:hypothetical protein